MASTTFNFYEAQRHSPAEVGPVPWSSSTRVCFRLGLICAALLILPFPFDVLPGTRFLAEQYAAMWSDALIPWFGDQIGFTNPASIQLIASAIVAFITTLGWTIVDNEDRSHTSLARLASTLLRFWIASAILVNGIDRLFATDTVTVAKGVVDCSAAALLLWRRTSTIGALIAAAGLTSLVVQSYDAGTTTDVRTFELLGAASVLVILEAPRLIAALLGYATRDRYADRRISIGWTLAKLWVVFWIIYSQLDAQLTWAT